MSFGASLQPYVVSLPTVASAPVVHLALATWPKILPLHPVLYEHLNLHGHGVDVGVVERGRRSYPRNIRV